MITSDKPGLLKEKGLKVTPQRIAVLEALDGCSGEHPTAEAIIKIIRKKNPSITTGTIYKILDVLVEHDLLKKVNTDKNIMRYDVITSQHHHLYSVDTDRIEDYYDEQLNRILNEYFKKRRIPGFRIEDIQVQIKGKFFDK